MYQFLSVPSVAFGRLRLNLGPVQISPGVNTNIREPLIKKGLHFLHSSKLDESKCISNKTKAATIGLTESKLGYTVLDVEGNLPGYDILRRDRNRNVCGVACYVKRDLCFNTRALHHKEVENI